MGTRSQSEQLTDASPVPEEETRSAWLDIVDVFLSLLAVFVMEFAVSGLSPAEKRQQQQRYQQQRHEQRRRNFRSERCRHTCASAPAANKSHIGKVLCPS